MKTIRRLYFYAVALISLETVVWGVIGLLRSIIDRNAIVDGAYALAQALSLILVGVPIFLFHWIWAQNVSAKDDEEKTATLRAVFLYTALLATLIPVVQNLLAFINRTFLSTARLYTERAFVGGSQTLSDNAIAIVFNLLIAAYFWNILQGEWKTLPETENFAEIRRLYRFIWMLYGLAMVVYGAQQALNFVFTLPGNVLGEYAREDLVNALALTLVGVPIWFFSWRIIQNALPDPAEKESYLRLGILYLLALGGVITTLTSAGQLLYELLMRLFGEPFVFAEFLKDIGRPISVGLPFGVLWAYYGDWLGQQWSFEGNESRRAGKKRIYYYILSLIGLGATFFGVLALFSLVIDQITVEPYLSDGGFRPPLSGALAAVAVGLPVWLFAWLPMQNDAFAENEVGDHARRSVIRKSYLYLVLFGAVIGVMISAGALIFNVVNQLLGGYVDNFINTVLDAVQALVLCAALLLYHLSALRSDASARADALEEKQAAFAVLVLDPGDGKFGEGVRSVFAKRAPKVQVRVLNANDSIPADAQGGALILPGSLAVNTPKSAEAWIRSFNGTKLVVGDEAAGVFWMNDFGQAADSALALAEGQELRPQSPSRMTSVWTYVAYVFAALFACQLLFGVLMFGISMVGGGF